jgi:hypothetical protein
MNITIFKDFQDISNPHTITIEQALDRIRTGRSKATVEAIREKVSVGMKADDEKKSLPCILFSAAEVKMIINRNDNESCRDDKSVVKHSGFFALDFDKCDVRMKMLQMKSDPYVFAAWVSPSGTGIRALVRCPASVEHHGLYYTAFLERYPDLDVTSRNISRICFESYDPNLYVNSNSLTWDKRLTEEERRKNKEKATNRRANKILATAAAMVRASYDGQKHQDLLKAANLLGGYIATGRVNEDEAIALLESEIKMKGPADMSAARKTIIDGIEFGKSRPLVESKKIEKSLEYLRREDGSYDFLANQEEMDDYLRKLISGELEMGVPTGLRGLDPYWVMKKNHLVFFAGLDSVGKSFFVWWLAVAAARFHGWKIIINSAENSDGQLQKKLMEYYIGKSVKVMDDEELSRAALFVRENFRIISSTQMHTLEEFLLKCEILMDEGFDATVVIGEPWNSFDTPLNADRYSSLIHSLNQLRVFKENYCSVWIADHVNTSAARLKDKDGYILPPGKADVEGGTMKANKCDDFIIIHRIGNHPFKKRETQIHVHKIKNEEEGGRKTDKDEPVIIELTENYCGFTSNGINPMIHSRI